jgi:HEAT repeat protein
MSDSDSSVRYFTARSLGEQGRESAVEGLIRLAFEDPAGHVRLAAVDALGRLASAQAIPMLALLTEMDDAERAKAALGALGAISNDEAWAPLEAALRSGDAELRAAAAQAAARHGGPNAVGALEWAAASDESETVVETAVRGLGSLAAAGAAGTSDGVAAVKALVGLTADTKHRELVIGALAGLPAVWCDDVAAHGLQDPRTRVRVAILEAFGRMRRADASRWLREALDDPHPEVRLAALGELRHLGTRGVERKLVILARTDSEAGVRHAALTILKGTEPES